MPDPVAPVARNFGPNLLAGSLCALMTLAYASSFATLIFGGALAPVASLGETQLPAGGVLFRRGEDSGAMYILLEGRVSVNLPLADSNYAKRLRSYGPGTIVGEMGFFDQAVRSADVTADVESRLARLDRDSLHRLETDQPALTAHINRLVITTLAARLRTANDELRNLF